jgi:hypothetical protein
MYEKSWGVLFIRLWWLLNPDVSKDCKAFNPEDLNVQPHSCEDMMSRLNYETSPKATYFKSRKNDRCWHWIDIKAEGISARYSNRRLIENVPGVNDVTGSEFIQRYKYNFFFLDT